MIETDPESQIMYFCINCHVLPPLHHPLSQISYKLLNPKGVNELKDSKEPKKTAQCILDAVALDAELYRLGNTKA